WSVIFFFASAGASAGYLTVGEIFPLEIRANAIAFFFAIGTGLGGIIGPFLFGKFIDTGSRGWGFVGYLIGAAAMIMTGLAGGCEGGGGGGGVGGGGRRGKTARGGRRAALRGVRHGVGDRWRAAGGGVRAGIGEAQGRLSPGGLAQPASPSSTIWGSGSNRAA